MDHPRPDTDSDPQLPSPARPSVLRSGLLRGRRRSRLRRVLLATSTVAALVAGAVYAAPGGLAAVGASADGDDPDTGKPVTFLLAGLDKRAGLTQKQKNTLHVNGEAYDCTDVMMLVRLNADRDRVSVVSLPRDSYVRFAPHKEPERVVKEEQEQAAAEKKKSDGEATTDDDAGRDQQNAATGGLTEHYGKINAAHKHGGPELTKRTVEQATGVHIDHYLETDFTGFAETVDKLGGSPVCTDKPLKDANSGLDLAKGSHRLDGKHALRYVRARHIQPSGDLGRVRRQQRLLAEMLGELTSDRVAGNPVELLGAARSLSETVRTDGSLSLGQLVSLGRELRGLPADGAEFATVPIAEFDYRAPQWGSSLLWDEPRAKAMFTALRADRPLRDEPRIQPPPGVAPVEFDPADVPVRVAGGGEQADRVETGLRDDGFAVAARETTQPKPAPRKNPVIVYDPTYERDAAVLATALPGAELAPVKGHGRTTTVRPGTGRVVVAKVIHDRSSVEGAPVSAKELRCADEPSDGAAATPRSDAG